MTQLSIFEQQVLSRTIDPDIVAGHTQRQRTTSLPSIEEIRERFELRGSDLVYRVDVYRPNSTDLLRRAGEVAGCINKAGYRQLMFRRRNLLAHRVAFALATGSWSAKDLDHKDRNKLNNAIDNLVETTNRRNQQNRRENSGCGKGPGARFHAKKQRWQSGISILGHHYFLGYYDTPEEATRAYRKIESILPTLSGKTDAEICSAVKTTLAAHRATSHGRPIATFRLKGAVP